MVPDVVVDEDEDTEEDVALFFRVNKEYVIIEHGFNQFIETVDPNMAAVYKFDDKWNVIEDKANWRIFVKRLAQVGAKSMEVTTVDRAKAVIITAVALYSPLDTKLTFYHY